MPLQGDCTETFVHAYREERLGVAQSVTGGDAVVTGFHFVQGGSALALKFQTTLGKTNAHMHLKMVQMVRFVYLTTLGNNFLRSVAVPHTHPLRRGHVCWPLLAQVPHGGPASSTAPPPEYPQRRAVHLSFSTPFLARQQEQPPQMEPCPRQVS